MSANVLKLNDDKIEFFILGTHQQLLKVSQLSPEDGDSSVPPSDQPRYLAVIFEEEMSSDQPSVARSASIHLRHNGNIRLYLCAGTTQIFVHSNDLSR